MVRLLFCSLCFALSMLGCASDGDERPEGIGGHGGEHSHEQGADLCCELGAICHSFDEDLDEEVSECHQLGHRNDAEVCAENYERCKAACAGVTDDPVEHSCE